MYDNETKEAIQELVAMLEAGEITIEQIKAIRAGLIRQASR